MKRRNLLKTKKLMIIITTASMIMSSVVPALADSDEGYLGESVMIGSVVGVEVSATGGKTESETEKNATASLEGEGNATGVSAISENGSTATVEIENDVTATVTSSVNYGDAAGVSASAYNESNTTVSIGNDVSSNSSNSAVGVAATATGNSKTEVDIGGELTVSGGVMARGIQATSGSYSSDDDNSSVIVTVGGNVTVSKGDEGYATAIGADAYSDDSSVSVTVEGDVAADGFYTIYANGPGDVDINIGGSVINKDKEGTALSLQDAEMNSNNTATLTVTVATDINAAGDAVAITKTSDKSSIDLVVEGTITGEHAIVLNTVTDSSTEEESQSSTANLNITVWKVESTDSSGDLVSDAKSVSDTSGSKKEYTKNTEAENNINYIIKVDPIASSIGGSFTVSGETDSHGYHTAHAGDTVYLELNIPSNYAVDSFYNVNGAADVKVISSDGKYYLEVPRGGGVFVGVNLKKLSNYYGSGSNSESDTSDNDWTVGNNQSGNSGVYSSEAFTGLTFQITGLDGSSMALNVLDVLKPLDPISALNNFTVGVISYDLSSVLGAGIVDFKDTLATALSDTIDVPVAASVSNGKYYVVYFSDGSSTTIQCISDGILNIPFNKNTAGLTYMIYESPETLGLSLPG